ncbi:MAG: mechanosensitive ion channel [Planctomycetes bacterium]|nr:mechanosensitive ion channel [Planctomycetota bacterium]
MLTLALQSAADKASIINKTTEAVTKQGEITPTDAANQTVAATGSGVDWAARLAEKGFDWAVDKGPSIIAALVILFIAWIIAGWLRRLIITATNRTHVDATLGKFLGNLAKWAVLGFSVTICLTVLGIPATTFAAVVAAIGLAVGLALQGNLGNLASGVLLLIFRPFKVGDSVIVAGQAGVVESIDLFTTNLDTADNRRVIVPNGAICGGVIENQSHHERRCLTIIVQTSGALELNQTQAALEAAARSFAGKYNGALTDPAPAVGLMEIAPASTWSIGVWISTAAFAAAKPVLLAEVKHAIDKGGLGVPPPVTNISVVAMPK